MRNNLKTLMQQRKITQQHLERETGVTQATISKWCNNHNHLYSASVIARLCAYFDIDVGDLLVLADDSE